MQYLTITMRVCYCIEKQLIYLKFNTAFSRLLPPVPPPHSFYAPYSEQENQYQAQNPIEQQLPYTQPKRNYNNKQYFNGYDKTNSNNFSHQRAGTHDTEYLPSDIREELLYRMLMLSIQSDIGATMSNIQVPDASTIKIASISTSPAESNSKKPVRSVQILGEE